MSLRHVSEAIQIESEEGNWGRPDINYDDEKRKLPHAAVKQHSGLV